MLTCMSPLHIHPDRDVGPCYLLLNGHIMGLHPNIYAYTYGGKWELIKPQALLSWQPKGRDIFPHVYVVVEIFS